jgi:hypothetical protein
MCPLDTLLSSETLNSARQSFDKHRYDASILSLSDPVLVHRAVGSCARGRAPHLKGGERCEAVTLFRTIVLDVETLNLLGLSSQKGPG